MARRSTNSAEYYRAHRAAFERAQRDGITPAVAAELIRHEERMAELQAKIAEMERVYGPVSPTFERWDAQHMMRD